MKTIWIMNHYATMPSNGPLPRHYYLATRFKNKGYKVIIFASNQLHSTGTEVEIKKGSFVRQEENGIVFLFLKTLKYKGNGIKRIFNMISFYFALLKNRKRIAKEFGKPDLIIASSAHLLTCVAGIKIAKKFHINCISEVRDLWPEELFTTGKVKEKSLFGHLLLNMEKSIYLKSNDIVFTKEGDVDHIKEMKWDTDSGGRIDLRKCHYINNGVDFEEWDKNLNTYTFDLNSIGATNKFLVGYAGSIRPMNNVELLLKTAELLKNDNTIMFVVAGAGSLLDQIRDYASKKQLTNIIFTGYLDKKTVPSFLSQMNVNVLVYSDTKYNWSRGNSSNKLFEYMASGKPIISTVRTGYSIIQKYSCGVELEKCDDVHLAEAIKFYKNCSKKEYNDSCNKSLIASKDFDFNKLSQAYLDIIENNLKEKEV